MKFTRVIRSTKVVDTGVYCVIQPKVLYGTEYIDKNFNQRSLTTMSGDSYIYSRAIKFCLVSLLMQMPEAQAISLRSFFLNQLNTMEEMFNLDLEGLQVDLGRGLGVNLTNCELYSPDYKIGDRLPVNMYNTRLEFRYVL